MNGKELSKALCLPSKTVPPNDLLIAAVTAAAYAVP